MEFMISNEICKPEYLNMVLVFGILMERWVEIVRAFQQITIDAQGGYDKRDFDPERVSGDPWVAWNLERDKLASGE